MSQKEKRGKKRSRGAFENVLNERDTVKDIHKLARPPRKKRKRNRTLPRNLQQIMAKANSAYMNKDYSTAKLLAQEVRQGQPKYFDVYHLLGKISEQENDYSNALIAYATYIALRFKNKRIKSETSQKLLAQINSDDSDSSDSDFDNDTNDTNPTPELIEKIANLALKSENYSMSLEAFTQIETHYRLLLNKINNNKFRNKIIELNDNEIEIKKQEIITYLVNIYHKRANIYKTLQRWDLEKKEYELIYYYIHRNTHPLIMCKSDLKIDLNHRELLYILDKIGPKLKNQTAYKYLNNYFEIFLENNKFEVNNNKYILWLINEINNNNNIILYNKTYKQLFYSLFRRFVNVSMEMYRFNAILRFLEYFSDKLSETFSFPLTIKKGICLLWLNKFDISMKYYNKLITANQNALFGELYYRFLDALIAKNKLNLANELMDNIKQISHFNIPHIWLRFADCYTLQKKYNLAIDEYIKVINNEKNENLILSAQLKLLQIYFIKNDEINANKLLNIIHKYKDNSDEKNNAEINEDSTVFKPQKRMRLNPLLISYFECGLFGTALVPKELLQLELLNIELRTQYKECLNLFKTQQYYKYICKCESKIIQLFALCHSAPNLIDKKYKVILKEAMDKDQFGLQLEPYNKESQVGAVVISNFNYTIGKNDIRIKKWSHIFSINGEEVTEWKLDEIKHVLNNGIIPMEIEFMREQNIFPLLKQNRNSAQKRIYTINHLAHVLKDSRVLELIVYLCKIWYECDAMDENFNVSEYKKLKQIELMLNIICEASLSLNSQKMELNEFFMAELHLLMANIYFNNNYIETCYHQLIKVLQLQPNNLNAMRYLYLIYRHSHHHPKIERTIKRQLEKKNDNNMVWHQLILGHTSFSKNSYDIAAHTYSNIIKMYKNSQFMHLMLAVTYLQHAMKRTTKQSKYFVIIQGIAFIKRYVKLSKNTTESLYNFARAFHLLGLYGSAQVLYEKIINRIKYMDCNDEYSLDPILRYCAYNLSKIYLRSGQTDLAIQTLKHNIIV